MNSKTCKLKTITRCYRNSETSSKSRPNGQLIKKLCAYARRKRGDKCISITITTRTRRWPLSNKFVDRKIRRSIKSMVLEKKTSTTPSSKSSRSVKLRLKV